MIKYIFGDDMYCFSIGKRNLENLFHENMVCRFCYQLEMFVIGLTKHFIVHSDNIILLSKMTWIDDYILIDSLDFKALEVVSELGSMIIFGNNYINCPEMLPLN